MVQIIPFHDMRVASHNENQRVPTYLHRLGNGDGTDKVA